MKDFTTRTPINGYSNPGGRLTWSIPTASAFPGFKMKRSLDVGECGSSKWVTSLSISFVANTDTAVERKLLVECDGDVVGYVLVSCMESTCGELLGKDS